MKNTVKQRIWSQISHELCLIRLLIENYMFKNHEGVFEAYKADRQVLGV